MSRLPPFANQVLDRCGSTNDLARELGEAGAPHGTWVSARAQDHGRGRLGREWQSREGNLFLSMVAKLEDKSRWTWVPLATAVAAARALRARYSSLDLRIKWPNDLWIMRGDGKTLEGAKAGGILCEAVGDRNGSFIVIGMGLNCASAPESLDQKTTSLSLELGARILADDVRDEIIPSILATLGELSTRGPGGLVSDFERWAVFGRGAPIEWTHPSGREPAGRGEVLGLGPHGELRVMEDGAEKRLFAEDIRIRATAAVLAAPSARRGACS